MREQQATVSDGALVAKDDRPARPQAHPMYKTQFIRLSRQRSRLHMGRKSLVEMEAAREEGGKLNCAQGEDEGGERREGVKGGRKKFCTH